MKIVFGVICLLLGYGIHTVVDLRQNYALSLKYAEAECKIFVLSEPDNNLTPADIDCKVVVDDDVVLEFEVNKAAGWYLSCLPTVPFVKPEISSRACGLYERKPTPDTT